MIPTDDVITAPPPPRIPVRGGGQFPVRRVYCVGRNFADHAREMGAAAPASKAERGTPVFFLKPDLLVLLLPHLTEVLHNSEQLLSYPQ
jgi:hypothetical protein